MPSSFRIILVSVVTLIAGLLAAGCTPRRGNQWPLPLEIVAERIRSDDTGAWVVLGQRAASLPEKPLSPNYCLVRRYRPDGSIQGEANLGVGICRVLRVDAHGVLALLVNDVFTDEEWAAFWRFDGAQWQNCGPLPCQAIGASRLTNDSILVWDETRLFKSTDEGRTWSRLPLTISGRVKWRLARESIVAELAGGTEILLAVSVHEGGRGDSVRLGRYSPHHGFREELSLPGSLAGSATHPDGEPLILVHESDKADGEPSLKLYELRQAASAAQVIHEESSVLPREVYVTGRKVVIVGSTWITPTSFFSTFPTRVTSLQKTADGTWMTKRENQIEAWHPRKVSISPDGHAWCTYSNLREHGLVLVEQW